MLGPLVNSAALAAGSLIGGAFRSHFPQRIKLAMPMTFGLVAISIGTVMVNKVHTLPALALALLLGAFVGELLYLERWLERSIAWIRKRFQQRGKTRPDAEEKPVDAVDYVSRYVTSLVLFCVSGMGIFGAIHEGISGDASLLMAKAMLDFFTAVIFAVELGYPVALIAFPMLLIQGALYMGANLLVPLVTPTMLDDFSACGGVILLATGLRVCGIKIFPIVNMMPALLFVMPCSALWVRFFH